MHVIINDIKIDYQSNINDYLFNIKIVCLFNPIILWDTMMLCLYEDDYSIPYLDIKIIISIMIY